VNILGFLGVSKIDAIQQKAADLNKIPLLIEITMQYPITWDILWALSFNMDIQQQLRSNAAFIASLLHLAKESDNEQMRKATHGILWNLESTHQERTLHDDDSQPRFDIMISYSHKDQFICKRIYEELNRRGYRVWIDFEQIHGNVMDAMAQAIEHSQMIIICMSEQYHRSNYCRAEAHYAFQRQLRLVPVLLQKHYKPDGWLLFLIGQLLYVDFTNDEFGDAMQLLINELKAETSPLPIALSTLSTDSTAIKTDVIVWPKHMHHWNTLHVRRWLLTHGLEQMAQLLVDFNGPSLTHLYRFLHGLERHTVLTSLQADCLRRTGEHLSIVELSHLCALIEQKRPRIRLSRDKSFFRGCCSMM
jgi:hypothetical protein